MKKTINSLLVLSIGLTGLSLIVVSQRSKAQTQNYPEFVQKSQTR